MSVVTTCQRHSSDHGVRGSSFPAQARLRGPDTNVDQGLCVLVDTARSTEGFFSDIYCKNLVELLEVNLTIM